MPHPREPSHLHAGPQEGEGEEGRLSFTVKQSEFGKYSIYSSQIKTHLSWKTKEIILEDN